MFDMKNVILGCIGIAGLAIINGCSDTGTRISCSSPDTITTLQKLIDEKVAAPFNIGLRNPSSSESVAMYLRPDLVDTSTLFNMSVQKKLIVIKIREDTIITVRREGNKSTCKVMLQWLSVPGDNDITSPGASMNAYTTEITDKGDQIYVTLLP